MQTEVQLSGPIVEFEENIQSKNGFDFYIAYTDDVLDSRKKVLELGAKIAVSAKTVEKYGMDKLIGVRLQRNIRTK